MTTKNIRLFSINDVKEFVNAACNADFDIDLISGRYTVDAKSIMGIFSLDLSKPVSYTHLRLRRPYRPAA